MIFVKAVIPLLLFEGFFFKDLGKGYVCMIFLQDVLFFFNMEMKKCHLFVAKNQALLGYCNPLSARDRSL